MEYLPGMNLSELVRGHGPLPQLARFTWCGKRATRWPRRMIWGLMHRDIKPANIFAAIRGGRYDVAKLLDFGLAKPLFSGRCGKLTQEGAITGSPLYMSPEQAFGDREPDARSDIYALGAVLYFLLTAHPPFEDEQPMKVLIAHAHDPPAPPRNIRPTCRTTWRQS